MSGNRPTHAVLARAAMVAALLGLVGCADDAPSYAADIAPIFERTCSGCHIGVAPVGGLSFMDTPLESLVGMPSEQADMNLIEPGDSLQSYLWHKLASTQGIAGGSGSSMPLGTLLGGDEIDRVADWIDGGALP